jgi:peptidyl-prolyl cis-trans isomerase SurA
MKKLIPGFLLMSFAFCPLLIKAQEATSPILMTIAGTPVSKAEFEKVYRKNNNKEGAYDMKDVREYLDLYINYKLKVKEAEEEKLDTSQAFLNELKGYRKQLAQPYMTDKEVTDALIKEAYDRLQKDVRASHILLNLALDALPKDTLATYNRAIKIRDLIMKGADFAKVARDSSNDPSAKENGGDLGYFTGMQMVYPFESAAYNTKPGQVSMPVRTKFGYHLIKVVDVRDAQGEIKVAHIMIKAPSNAPDSVAKPAKAKIDEIYQKLKSGEKFEDLATKFSDD